MAKIVCKSDQSLLESIAAGDVDAFAAFYDRHSAQVYGVLTCILRDAAEAGDVLQVVFWQVWTQAGRYESVRAAPSAWLGVLARSRARDRLRQMVRVPRSSASNDNSVSDASVHEVLEAHEEAERIAGAMDKLPPEQRDAIRRAFFDGMTHSEIAVAENLPLGTVKTRIRQGIMKLRDEVQPA